MVLNQSADYALRAALYIARSGDSGPKSADVIAGALGVPRNYLGKVLHQLVGANVLLSTRGPHGGFVLAQPAGEITLEKVVAPFQELPVRAVCLLGNSSCNSAVPCAAHERWRAMSDPVRRFFQSTTIELMLGEGA
jgi:Rrf2 family transcriptional regulator, iron-sulfur cluster assembly transcription factor